ncbi:type VII secretion system-associated protein [Haloechinothrix sp. LS1_15]|uniref:type VII secretion system-associated protein n=1 Tax=Haloechinothrix sp. LS1_15 TaxID=2652248 RepID=UPI0037BFCEF9
MASPDESGKVRQQRIQPTPPITESMRAHARRNPGTWLHVIDEAYDPDGDVPQFAVVGSYPVDTNGDVVESFHPNEDYLPSPKALGYPEPTSELEELLQLVDAQHRPVSDLPPVVLRSILYVYAVSPRQNNLTGFYDRTGRIVVPAYTSRTMVPADWPGARELTGRQLLPFLAGHPLAINPHEMVTAVIPARHLEIAARGQR